MTFKDSLAKGFASIVDKTGKQFMIEYYSQTVGSIWDDDVVLAGAGSLFTSGVVLPIDTRPGSTDSVLVQQGKLQDNDFRLYVHGSLVFTGSAYQVKIGMGSPVGEEFTTIPLGGIAVEAQGQKIYKKVYLRRLTNGSLLGE